MNIFWLSTNPQRCAQYHCDKHVVKMVLEYSQLLSTAHHVLDGNHAPVGIYTQTHTYHPCAVWTRLSAQNYTQLLALLGCMLDEYKYRYGRSHKCEEVYPLLATLPVNIPDTQDPLYTTPPQCMPADCIAYDYVTGYRTYYCMEKRSIAKWSRRPIPYWFV